MAISLSFETIAEAIRSAAFPDCDMVLGIGRGGTVPACLIAYQLRLPLRIEWYNYRDEEKQPRYAEPQLKRSTTLPPGVRHILLVDDVAVTGKTLWAAKKRLSGKEVTTLVLKGTADIVLFPDIPDCVDWPWNKIS